MKAARVIGPHDLRIEEIEPPIEIGPKEVLINIHAAAICKTDLEIYAGTFPHLRTGLLKLPRIPGHEWSGVVAKVGSQVTRFQPGDRVTGDTAIGCGECEYCLAGGYNLCPNRQTVGVLRKDGAFTEQLVMPERHLYIIPDNISLDQAALVEPAAVAVHAIHQLNPKLGQQCVVFGDGPLGLLALQAVVNAGATNVVLVGAHKYKLDIGLDLGASYTINYRENESYMNDIRGWVGEQGPDLIVETSGNPSAIQDAIYLARPGGKIVDISFCGVKQIPIDIDILVAREISLIGSIANANAYRGALRLMSEGRIKTAPLITHKFPLQEALEAVKKIENREIDYVRVLLAMNHE